MLYQRIDDFAEVSCSFDAPGVEHENGKSAVLFEGEASKPLTECLACNVTLLACDVLEGVAKPIVNELKGGVIVPPILL